MSQSHFSINIINNFCGKYSPLDAASSNALHRLGNENWMVLNNFLLSVRWVLNLGIQSFQISSNGIL